MKCQRCGTEEILPFRCPYCNGYFCAEHRLPENHECPEIWKARAPREAAPRVTVESKTPYEYKITFGPRSTTRTFWFSPTEIKHLTISAILVVVVGLSYIFTLLGINLLTLEPAVMATASLLFAGLFLLHEIAHKLVAQHYGLWAEFRLILFGALLTLISVISPIKFISPGAVMIAGYSSKEVVGKTAVAGPLTNLLLSLVSYALASLFGDRLLPYFFFIAMLSATFNAQIALINVLPMGMLDGLKVFEWNKIVWAVVFTLSLALTLTTIVTFVYI